MEDDKDAAARPASSLDPVVALPAQSAPPPSLPNPPPPLPSPPLPSSSAAASASAKEEALPPALGTKRLRFAVELRPGETTIVSWKRLLKESDKGGGPLPNAVPADRPLPSQAGADALAEGEPKDEVPPPNRFSAVIEKIERLYMGNQSSEEELDDIPDDDQYDTEDSFIDDAELDEYFHVDKLSTKHSGYFVNKGQLEHIESRSSPLEAPKRRRRKDPNKVLGQSSRISVHSVPTNIDNIRVKDAARSEPVARKKVSSKVFAPHEHHNDEARPSKYKPKAITTGHKRKAADLSVSPEEPSTKSVPYKEFSSLPLESKDFDKHKAELFTSKDTAHKSRADDLFNPLHQTSYNKGVEIQSKKLQNGEAEVSAKVRRREKYGSSDIPAMNSSESAYSMYGTQQASTRVKEGSSLRPKGTTLERAIRDLEKIVAECRPPSLDLQEVDPTFQGIKRRLPREVKQKLAKVARLSASQGKISEDELVDRLMGILGHLVQRKTLKRNMREMVVLGISAKQQKADRFQQIKREVNEMIKARVSQSKSKLTEQQDGSADDFQEVINSDGTRSLKRRYNMDAALEDKICDLYDLYVEGMDEDKGPQSRKLYVELADLWPSGYMDNVGIKDAINRSKERKRILYRQHKVRDEERIKRKKLASTMRVDKSNPASQIRAGLEKPAPVVNTNSQSFASVEELNPNPPGSTGKSLHSVHHPTESGFQPALKNPDKVRGVNTCTNTNPENTSKASVDVKKV